MKKNYCLVKILLSKISIEFTKLQMNDSIGRQRKRCRMELLPSRSCISRTEPSPLWGRYRLTTSRWWRFRSDWPERPWIRIFGRSKVWSISPLHQRCCSLRLSNSSQPQDRFAPEPCNASSVHQLSASDLQWMDVQRRLRAARKVR